MTLGRFNRDSNDTDSGPFHIGADFKQFLNSQNAAPSPSDAGGGLMDPPTGGIFRPERNDQGPGERAQMQNPSGGPAQGVNPDFPRMPTPSSPASVTPPSEESRMGRPSQPTPSAPSSPSPVGAPGGTPPQVQTFTPMRSPQSSDLVGLQPAGSGRSLGSSGGLLGGGLGVPGQLGEDSKPDNLLMLLAQLAGQK